MQQPRKQREREVNEQRGACQRTTLPKHSEIFWWKQAHDDV